MTMRILGIDLAVSAQHKAIVLDPACGEFIGKQFSFRARPEELDRLLKRARKGASDEVKIVAVLEATGMAWYPVAVYLTDQGVDVYRVNGQKTKDFRRVLTKHAGSDRIDSRALTNLYQIAPDRIARCPLPNGELLALQRACRAYDRWQTLDVAEQNRMVDTDKWAWGGLHNLVPVTALAWMRQHWYNAWQVRDTGVDALTAAWLAEVNDAQADTDWIDRWVQRAEQMTVLYGSPDRVGYDDLQAIMGHSLGLRMQYKQEQEMLKKEKIIPLYESLYPTCPLTTIWGVGSASAATYRAFIQDINRFPTVEKFRLWCGIVPRSRQSGDGEAKGLPMTKAGPNLVKATLYMNAEVARQWDVQIADIYHRQMVNYGKHHIQAICACASHLASRIYAVLKEDRPYRLLDLQGNPISSEDSRQLCLQLRVPVEVRRRCNKRFRRAKAEHRIEQRTQRCNRPAN